MFKRLSPFAALLFGKDGLCLMTEGVRPGCSFLNEIEDIGADVEDGGGDEFGFSGGPAIQGASLVLSSLRKIVFELLPRDFIQLERLPSRDVFTKVPFEGFPAPLLVRREVINGLPGFFEEPKDIAHLRVRNAPFVVNSGSGGIFGAFNKLSHMTTVPYNIPAEGVGSLITRVLDPVSDSPVEFVNALIECVPLTNKVVAVNGDAARPVIVEPFVWS